MKTKIKSLIIICTLGLVGVLNANATLSYGTSEEVKTVKSENLYSTGFDLNEDAGFDYQMEAQLVTKSIADSEEAETIQMLIDKGIILSNDDAATFTGEAKLENLSSAEFEINAYTEIDYQIEAQLVTKMIANKEEAETIQKLIDEGKLVENK